MMSKKSKTGEIIERFNSLTISEGVEERINDLSDEVLKHYTIFDLVVSDVEVGDVDARYIVFISPKYSNIFTNALIAIDGGLHFLQLAACRSISLGFFRACVAYGLADSSLSLIIDFNRHKIFHINGLENPVTANKLFSLKYDVLKDAQAIVANMTLPEIIAAKESIEKLGYATPPEGDSLKQYEWFYQFCIQNHGRQGNARFFDLIGRESSGDDMFTRDRIEKILWKNKGRPFFHISSEAFKKFWFIDPVDFVLQDSPGYGEKSGIFLQAIEAIRTDGRLAELDVIDEDRIDNLVNKRFLFHEDIKKMPAHFKRCARKILENEIRL